MYYLLRFFSVIVTLFLSVMSSNYAVGQLFTLSAADFFCADYDEETLRNYNLNNNYPEGQGKCNKIHRPEIDEDKLFNGDTYEYVADFSGDNVIGCIAFSMLALCLAVLGFYHLYTCFYDAFVLNKRKNFFSNRVVDHCNNLPSAVKNAENVNNFKNLYDSWVK